MWGTLVTRSKVESREPLPVGFLLSKLVIIDKTMDRSSAKASSISRSVDYR